MRLFFTFLRKHVPYVLFCLVCAVLALEVGIRWVGNARHLYTEPCFEMSPGGEYWTYQRGFEGNVLGPTKVRIGPLGSRLHDSSSPASATRIAVVGDSVTFGQAVGEDATFAAQVSRSLTDMGHAVEVLNFGVQGHNVEMEIAHLRDVLAESEPHVAVLAFVSDDLNPKRAQNHVDRYGYLTKNTFGPPSAWGDFLRAGLRHSHFVLFAKERLLRFRAARAARPATRKPPAQGRSAGAGAVHPELSRFRDAIRRFDDMTTALGRVVTCLDLRDSDLARAIREVMDRDFPHLPYVHAPPALEPLEWEELIVRPDGHPSAFAHQKFAELLMPRLVEALAERQPEPAPAETAQPNP